MSRDATFLTTDTRWLNLAKRRRILYAQSPQAGARTPEDSIPGASIPETDPQGVVTLRDIEGARSGEYVVSPGSKIGSVEEISVCRALFLYYLISVH